MFCPWLGASFETSHSVRLYRIPIAISGPVLTAEEATPFLKEIGVHLTGGENSRVFEINYERKADWPLGVSLCRIGKIRTPMLEEPLLKNSVSD